MTIEKNQDDWIDANINVLAEAANIVYGDRQDQYGHPYDNYLCTGQIWEAMLNQNPAVTIPPGTISPDIVCLMLAAMKISREVNRNKRDNLVDIAGYVACAELCNQRAEQLKYADEIQGKSRTL